MSKEDLEQKTLEQKTSKGFGKAEIYAISAPLCFYFSGFETILSAREFGVGNNILGMTFAIAAVGFCATGISTMMNLYRQNKK